MTAPTPTPEQERALTAIRTWLDGDEQTFTLAGYAGTGKTTILRHVIDMLDSVRCATPTGKAAAVLGGKLKDTGVEVTTLHSLLYQPVEVTEADLRAAEQELKALKAAKLPHAGAAERVKKIKDLLEKGGCEFASNANPENRRRLVIVDEASMVGDDVEADLLRFAPKILWCGDPGQLPPVQGQDFFVRHKPDAVLETIHRQAADSAILRLATALRNGEKFTDWNDDDCVLMNGVSRQLLNEADQVITGKNVTRRGINRWLRGLRGFDGEYPGQGEKLVCLRNDHGRGLINGVGALAASAMDVDTFGDLTMDVAYEDRLFEALPIDPLAFRQYAEPKLTRRDLAKTHGAEFDFGYAITVHKSQGSEWDHVAVYDDKMRAFDKEARKRWSYTAVTRAAKRLTWMNPDARGFGGGSR